MKDFLWKVPEKKRANKQSSQSDKYIRKTFNSWGIGSQRNVLNATVHGVYYLILCSHCLRFKKKVISTAFKYKGGKLKSV